MHGKHRSQSFIVGAALVSTCSRHRSASTTRPTGRSRQEATTNSQILKTVKVLTDLYGPRLTGSPNLKGAGEWAIRQMESWGLQNGRLEPWEWGNPGWHNERLSAHIVSPVKDHLVAEALAWTPGHQRPRKGRCRANHVARPPHQAKCLLRIWTALKSIVNGKVVLVGAHQRVPVTFNDRAGAPRRT